LCSVEDPNLNTALRVEWCKAQEWVTQCEEYELVVEEMCQMLVILEFNACEWEKQHTTFQPSPNLELDDRAICGALLYANKQANMHCSLSKVFIND
jgi:hypothetical protein